MRKTFKVAALSAMLGGMLTTGITHAEERVFFGIATGGTGGTYYPLGGMLAQTITETAKLDGDRALSATAETGNASVANAALLGRKGIESAFIAADILDAAYHGSGQFEDKKVGNLRALGALYPETVQLVAQPELKTFSDLKGQSISSGSPGSGQWQLLGDLLNAYGMSRDDVKEDYSSFTQSAEKLKDNNLGASLITAGTPTSSIVELSNGHAVSIIPLEGDAIEALRKAQPYYTTFTLPAGTYKGVDDDINTIAVRAIWATHADLPEDIAYAVTKALYENTDLLAKVHVKGKEITLNTALDSVSIPLHPGAERYYREKGLIE